MKKNLSILASVVLIICLVSFAFDQIVSASTVHAASETHSIMRSAGSAEEEAAPLSRSPQLVVFVPVGVVFILFGIIAISPLLIGDPTKVLHEANRAEK